MCAVPRVSEICEASLFHEWLSVPYRFQQPSSVPRKQVMVLCKKTNKQTKSISVPYSLLLPQDPAAPPLRHTSAKIVMST